MNNPNRPEAVPFNDINSPGSYITAQGSLVRVEADALKQPQRSPSITVHSNDDTRLTKISDDPQLPFASAAKIAKDWNLPVNFSLESHHAGSASSVRG